MTIGRSCFAAFLILPTAVGAATIVPVNPGNVGDTFDSKLFTLDELNGTSFAGQQIDIDFVFTDMKYVEQDFHSNVGVNTFSLFLRTHPSTSGTTPPFLESPSGFLSDEFGDPLGVIDIGSTSSFRSLLGTGARLQSSTDGVLFHDIHFSVTLPSVENAEVTSASLTLDFVADSGQFVVGVPEPPSAVALFSLAATGLLGHSRRRRRLSAEPESENRFPGRNQQFLPQKTDG